MIVARVYAWEWGWTFESRNLYHGQVSKLLSILAIGCYVLWAEISMNAIFIFGFYRVFHGGVEVLYEILKRI